MGEFRPRYLVMHDYGKLPRDQGPGMRNPYHALVMPDGSLRYRNPSDPYGRKAEHVFKSNSEAIGLSYGGNVGSQPTPAAMATLKGEYDKIMSQFPGIIPESHGEAYLRTRGTSRQASKDGRGLDEASWRANVRGIAPTVAASGFSGITQDTSGVTTTQAPEAPTPIAQRSLTNFAGMSKVGMSPSRNERPAFASNMPLIDPSENALHSNMPLLKPEGSGFRSNMPLLGTDGQPTTQQGLTSFVASRQAPASNQIPGGKFSPAGSYQGYSLIDGSMKPIAGPEPAKWTIPVPPGSDVTGSLTQAHAGGFARMQPIMGDDGNFKSIVAKQGQPSWAGADPRERPGLGQNTIAAPFLSQTYGGQRGPTSILAGSRYDDGTAGATFPDPVVPDAAPHPPQQAQPSVAAPAQVAAAPIPEAKPDPTAWPTARGQAVGQAANSTPFKTVAQAAKPMSAQPKATPTWDFSTGEQQIKWPSGDGAVTHASGSPKWDFGGGTKSGGIKWPWTA